MITIALLLAATNVVDMDIVAASGDTRKVTHVVQTAKAKRPGPSIELVRIMDRIKKEAKR